MRFFWGFLPKVGLEMDPKGVFFKFYKKSMETFRFFAEVTVDNGIKLFQLIFGTKISFEVLESKGKNKVFQDLSRVVA